jgi:hypothetical protein
MVQNRKEAAKFVIRTIISILRTQQMLGTKPGSRR